MTVRTYLILLISVAALGAAALVGRLALSYQKLERELAAQELSAKAKSELKYAKEDLRRFMTTGDLLFGSPKGIVSYLAQPAKTQITQINSRLKKIDQEVGLEAQTYQKVQSDLKGLKELFSEINKGNVKGDEYDRYDQLTASIRREFYKLQKSSTSQAKTDQDRLNHQKKRLKELAYGLSVLYLFLIIALTWWGNRAISRPVAVISKAAKSSLDDGVSYAQQRVGPKELQELGEVLFRLINQLEREVERKTADLAEENRVRRLAEVELRELNFRQQELVEASVRFVPRPFLEFLGRSDLTLVRRGDSTRQSLGILFSDLRGFTSLAEGRSPEDIFNLLNRYLDAVVPSIHIHGGFVDKYIGDAIMALFPKSPQKSVESAIEMFHRLYDFVDDDGIELKMGVGLHWGEVILGTLGSQERWESTVIGDSVNLAARLEGMTKAYECPLIISDSVVKLLGEETPFMLRPLDLVRVKGRSTPVTIYEVLDAHPSRAREERERNRAEIDQAFDQYQRGDINGALVAFNVANQVSPNDPLPVIYIDRCKQLLERGIDPDWSGIFTHTSK